MNEKDLIKLGALQLYTLARINNVEIGEDKLLKHCVNEAKRLISKINNIIDAN